MKGKVKGFCAACEGQEDVPDGESNMCIPGEERPRDGWIASAFSKTRECRFRHLKRKRSEFTTCLV